MKMRHRKTQTKSPATPAVINGLGIRSLRDGHIVHRSYAIYGRSGSGKTTLSATFPKPILLLDIKDKGTDSIIDVEDIDVKDVESWEDIEEIYYFLKENPDHYKTIIFDTVTQMQQICMDYVAGGQKEKRVGDWGSLTRRQFGEVAGLMKDWIVNFRDLPLEVVFIAQERVTQSDESDNPDQMITPEVGPHVMPSIAIALNAAVAVIGNTFIRLRQLKKEVKGKKIEKEEVRYCLRVGPNPVYLTKLRKPKSIEAPSYIENPTYADIISAMKGE